MTLWRNLTISLFSLLLTFSLHADSGSSSAGGDGVIIDGEYHLLDFVESNIHNQIYFKNKNQFSEKVKNKIKGYINVSDEVAELVAAKLYEVYDRNAILELLIKRRLFSLNWLIMPGELINVRDEDLVISFPGHTLVQLAVRQGSRVFINQESWNRLNAENKVGLIFHEIIYSLGESFRESGSYPSPAARLLTSLLFDQKIENVTKEKLVYILKREGLKINNPDSDYGYNKVFVKRDIGSMLKYGDVFYSFKRDSSSVKAEVITEEFGDTSLTSISAVNSDYEIFSSGRLFCHSPYCILEEEVDSITDIQSSMDKMIAGDHPEYKAYSAHDTF